MDADLESLLQEDFWSIGKRSGQLHRPHFFFVKKSPIPKISIETHQVPALERRATEDGNYKQWRKMGKRKN